MSMPAYREWTCIKCGRKDFIGPCANCGAEYFDLTSTGITIECGRCERGWVKFRCAVCGAETPVTKSGVAEPGDSDSGLIIRGFGVLFLGIVAWYFFDLWRSQGELMSLGFVIGCVLLILAMLRGLRKSDVQDNEARARYKAVSQSTPLS